jgi:nucleotide-binding universal stress UspA family protein
MSDPAILVSLDGTKNALRALPVARHLADVEGSPVRILHTSEQVRPLTEAAQRLGLGPAHLRGATLEVRAGKPAETILAAAADCQARLIVMSAYPDGAQPADAIGDAALAVLLGATCPVVLVNPSQTPDVWALKRVLIPYDGSPAVSDALGPAVDLARRAGAELVVLQAADGEHAAECGSITPPLYVDQPQHEWPAWTDEVLQRLASVCPLADLPVRLLVGKGGPAEEALRAASEESADLIALAWKGHWDSNCAPTLKAVLRAAPCPVLVTRTAAA